jgi:hypothetical protein
MKFYSDENFPRRTIEELRNLGHDVLTTLGDDRANQAIVVARATELDRAVLTLNFQDFKRLHLKNSNHSGIVICKDDADRIRQAQRIDEKVREVNDIKGQLIRVYRPDK